MKRRTVLATLGVAVVPVAGCAGQGHLDTGVGDTDPTATNADTPSNEYGITTPAPGDCVAHRPQTPTPTVELDPKTYPDYPDPLTVDTGQTFAIEYERAYWHNWVISKPSMAGTDEVIVDPVVPNWAVIEHLSGYVIGVNGVVRTGDTEPPPDMTPGTDTPTSVPSLDLPYSAWYYLGPSVGLRNELEGDFHTNERADPDLTGATVI